MLSAIAATAITAVSVTAPVVALATQNTDVTSDIMLMASSYTYGDFTYTASGNQATISGYTGSGGVVEIPSQIEGMDVVAVAKNAFQKNSNITEVVIPNTVTDINYRAFYQCTALEKVIFGNGLETIGEDSFRGCTELTTVTIPDSANKIHKNAFQGCSRLTEVVIGNGVETIGEGAFGDCTSLEKVVIGDKVTKIDNYAFSGCNKLCNLCFSHLWEEHKLQSLSRL